MIGTTTAMAGTIETITAGIMDGTNITVMTGTKIGKRRKSTNIADINNPPTDMAMVNVTDMAMVRGREMEYVGMGLNGRLNPRHPGLVLACDSDGHHCRWERRVNYNYRYPQTRMNPAAFGGGYNQGPYDNGYYGYSPMDNFAPVLAPLLGWQQP